MVILVVAIAAVTGVPVDAAGLPISPQASATQSQSNSPPSASKNYLAQKKQPSSTPVVPLQAQKMAPVVVTTRIAELISNVGTAVTVIDSEQIESQKIQTVSKVLEQVPGVTVTQSGSPGTVTDVSIRGSTPAQTLIMVDGVELNTGATGEFDISSLTTDNLDQVEFVRGAGGALNGSQEIGGSI